MAREARLGQEAGAIVVEAARAAEGLALSLRAGLERVASTAPATGAAALVVLGDQPAIRGEVIDEVVRRWRITGAEAVRPRYAERPDEPGHPVLLDRRLWAEVIPARWRCRPGHIPRSAGRSSWSTCPAGIPISTRRPTWPHFHRWRTPDAAQLFRVQRGGRCAPARVAAPPGPAVRRRLGAWRGKGGAESTKPISRCSWPWDSARSRCTSRSRWSSSTSFHPRRSRCARTARHPALAWT